MMERSIKQWKKCEAAAIAEGSIVQVTFALIDAKKDIAELASCLRDLPECRLAFATKKDLKAWNAWKAKYEDLLEQVINERD